MKNIFKAAALSLAIIFAGCGNHRQVESLEELARKDKPATRLIIEGEKTIFSNVSMPISSAQQAYHYGQLYAEKLETIDPLENGLETAESRQDYINNAFVKAVCLNDKDTVFVVRFTVKESENNQLDVVNNFE